jgi:hypothetical protein
MSADENATEYFREQCAKHEAERREQLAREAEERRRQIEGTVKPGGIPSRINRVPWPGGLVRNLREEIEAKEK